MVAAGRIELPPRVYETLALPLSYTAKKVFDRVGLEPTIPRLKGECLGQLGYRSVRQTRMRAASTDGERSKFC